MNSERYYLSQDIFIKFLEKPYLYNRKTDELYEMDMEGFKFLQNLLKDNKKPKTKGEKKFIYFLLKNKLITREKNIELPLKKVKEVVEDFEKMQGLKLLVSVGEPLLNIWVRGEHLPLSVREEGSDCRFLSICAGGLRVQS